MANKTINQLPNDTELNLTDKLPIQEVGGTTKNVTGQMILDFVSSNLPAPPASDLESVLLEGNSTGASDITISNGQTIKNASNNSGLRFSQSFGNDIMFLGQDDSNKQYGITFDKDGNNYILINANNVPDNKSVRILVSDGAIRMTNQNTSNGLSSQIQINQQIISMYSEDADGNSSNNTFAGSYNEINNSGTSEDGYIFSASIGTYDVANGPQADTADSYLNSSRSGTSDLQYSSVVNVKYNFIDINTVVNSTDATFSIKDGLEIDPEGNNEGTRLYSEDLNSGALSTVNVVNATVGISANDENDASNLIVYPGLIQFNPGNLGKNGGKKVYGSNIQTNNSTPTTVFTLPISSIGIRIVDVKVKVLGRTTSGDKVYSGELNTTFKSISGTITRVGVLDKIEKSEFSTATSDVTFSGGDILFNVVGESVNMVWIVYIEVIG